MRTLDKKGFTEHQVREAFADNDGKSLFDVSVKEYAAGNEAKGVWATVQAGYDMVAQYYTTHAGIIPVGKIDYKSFGKFADELAK